MPGFIGVPELLLLGIVLLLLFGPKRLPEMGRSLGRGMREFKESVTHDGSKSEQPDDEQPKVVELPPAAATAEVVPVPQREEAA